MIKIKRVYWEYDPKDGKRILIDRLWPRGLSKDKARIDLWLKDIAPTAELRQWFGHEVERWDEFRERYWAELDANLAAWQPLVDAAKHGPIMLLFGARDREHNQAVVLRDYLMRKLARH